MLRWMMEDCTPGPPKAMRMTAGRCVGQAGVEAAKRRKPSVTSRMLSAEHMRGPYASSSAPSRSGAVKLMEVAITKSRCTTSGLVRWVGWSGVADGD